LEVNFRSPLQNGSTEASSLPDIPWKNSDVVNNHTGALSTDEERVSKPPSHPHPIQSEIGMPRAIMPDDLGELIRWSLIDKEAIYPIEYFEGVIGLRYESTPWLMSTRKLLQSRVRVAEREGANLIRFLRWWMRSFIALILLALLTFALTTSSWTRHVSVLSWLPKGIWLLTLTSLVVGFSMGRMVQKVGSYGWLRCLRLSWLVGFRKPFTKVSDLQESLRIQPVSWRSVDSSLNSSRDSNTYTR
jgi:hypothetical protein